MTDYTTTLTSPTSTAQTRFSRIESIDLLRGVVMIIMALDHVRDYFHADAFLFNPLDLEKTNGAIFFTRWITHFCAPVFVFLAGTSAYLVGTRKGKAELTSFLIKRGVWLLILEFTIINIAWFFNPDFKLIALTVIWALGVGMILLAAAIHLPFKLILVLGIAFVAGHNLLDSTHVGGTGTGAIFWSLLHEQRVFEIGRFIVFVGYPILPWTGLMLLGYCFGTYYQKGVDPSVRKKFLLWSGVLSITAFIILRMINVYGDLFPWTTQPDATRQFLSFMNVTKYPPSLDYVLITLGPSLLFLAMVENVSGKISGVIVSLGRVPMFYYVIHIYVIHIIAVIAAVSTGYQFNDMVFVTWVTDSPDLKGYGFNLATVYFVWIAVVAALLPLCVWYDHYKLANKDKWWLSYL
jgi:uncharacterized membrane protein